MKLNQLNEINWSITGLKKEQVEKLVEIPGLKPTGIQMDGVQGWVDSVAAACKVLKIECPRRQLDHKVTVELAKDKRLRDYQIYGVNFIVDRLRTFGGCILADDMGLGKTLQALTAAKLVLADTDRLLVIAPRAAAETWFEELEKWGFKDSVVLGPPSNSKYRNDWDRANKARFVVTSPILLAKTMEFAFDYKQPRLIIIDEVHRFKGRPNARRGTNKIGKEIEQTCNIADMILELSGTPVEDRPRDAYQVLKMARLKFGSGYEFDMRYCDGSRGLHNEVINKGVSNAEELKLRLSYFMLRREKREVATELPPITRQVRWVDPTHDAIRALQRFRLGTSRGALDDALQSALKGKMEEAIDLAVELKQFLLFTKLRAHAREMARMLTADYGTPCVCITGDVDAKIRQKLVREAEAKKWGIVATLDAASEALNMQFLSHGIMHAIDYRPRLHLQGEARIHRLGSKDPVQWTYLAMKDSADAMVMGTLLQKMDQLSCVTTGTKTMSEARSQLGDRVDGKAAEAAEKEVLNAIYASLK